MPTNPYKLKKSSEQKGFVVSFFSSVAKIQGLANVSLHEVLVDEEDTMVAIVIGFDAHHAEALFFEENFVPEKPVFQTAQIFSVPISDTIVGRVVDGLGRSRDRLGPVFGSQAIIFKDAPAIIDRKPVTTPLSTGIKILDTALPLGRGQRELIIGDRKLGKSTLALDIVLNQKRAKPQVFCIYVLIGQKAQKLHEIMALFEKNNAFLYTIIVAATAQDSFAAQYLAPFVGCAIGEYFRDQGKDALVVYDDLSKHARIYRSIMLLLERAPGREAYPGDIFSLHAKLLERSACMSDEKKGGSLSALPIVETEEGDITSFIPTNSISITDGQIFLEQGLFQKGFLPAVNIGLSVSRVGSRAQPKVLKEVVGGIRLMLSQHKELQKLTQMETVLSDQAKVKIHRGELVLELLRQEKHVNVTWAEQAIFFYVVEKGFFDDIEKEKWRAFEHVLLELIRNRYLPILKQINQEIFNEEVTANIEGIVRDAKQEFLSN